MLLSHCSTAGLQYCEKYHHHG